MIDAYYSLGSDSKELFSKFEISKSPDFEKHLNKYNVIHIDISSVADFYKDESALNNFREYTMINSRNLTKYFGFPEEEVKTLCDEYGMPFDSIKNGTMVII